MQDKDDYVEPRDQKQYRRDADYECAEEAIASLTKFQVQDVPPAPVQLLVSLSPDHRDAPEIDGSKDGELVERHEGQRLAHVRRNNAGAKVQESIAAIHQRLDEGGRH